MGGEANVQGQGDQTAIDLIMGEMNAQGQEAQTAISDNMQSADVSPTETFSPTETLD
jgi:hypothetical protein